MSKTVAKAQEQPVAKEERAEREPRFVAPEVNIYETRDGFVLEAEMPGVNKDGLEVTIEGNTLTIAGRRSDPTPPGRPVYRESRPVNYRRVFELDPSIDTDRISARMHQGVLTLTLPKTEQTKPRKIAVTD